MPNANWIETNNVAQFEGADWNNWISTASFTGADAAQAFAAENSNIDFFFYCRQFMMLNNGRSFQAGDAAFFSGQPWFGSAPQCDTYQKLSFATPSFIHDFELGSAQDAAVCLQWNTNITGFTDQAILGNPWNMLYASAQSAYFNTALTAIPSSAAAVIITWHAFPNRLAQYLGAQASPPNRYNFTPQQLLAIADQYGSSAVPLPSFQQIPTELCPQANWDAALHMYGPYGPRGWQDEYCEWSVVRAADSGKITRIDFTCENPEYWNTLWMVDPQKVADLYSATLSFGLPAGAGVTVPVSDLYLTDPSTGQIVVDPSTARPAYNPLNKWNNGPQAIRSGGAADSGGAMHLTSTPNTLQTEMALAGGATIQRPCGNSVPQTLICCAQYGQAYRNSDPHIGQQVNQAVGGQLTGGATRVALANPTGLYIQVPDLSGFTLPQDPKLPANASAQDCWQIVRGCAELTDPVTGMLFGATPGEPQNGGNFVLHAVFQLPQAWVDAGVQFTVGDICDATGARITWGGQIVQRMSIGLWARPLPAAAQTAEPCVLPPPAGVTPPKQPQPPNFAQPLQLFHSALWNAYYNTTVPNPMNVPIALASNSTLIAPIVQLGQTNVPMSLTCNIAQPSGGQWPTVDFGPDITVQVTGYDNINYAVPGNSYPSDCGVLRLLVSIGPNAELGLRDLSLTNVGDPVQAPMPALLNVVVA